MYGLAIRSTLPESVLMSRMLRRGDGIGLSLSAPGTLHPGGTHPPNDLVDFLGHERLAGARHFRRVDIENVATCPPKNGIVPRRFRVAAGEDARDRDARPNRGSMIMWVFGKSCG
jgi:hypothetical protein